MLVLHTDVKKKSKVGNRSDLWPDYADYCDVGDVYIGALTMSLSCDLVNRVSIDGVHSISL